jgi:hypothetical protein
LAKKDTNSASNTIPKNIKAEDIMEMTPAQKNEFLSRRKLQQKKEAEIEAAKKDAKTLIIERKQPACKAYLEAKHHRQESVPLATNEPVVTSLSK